jgi:photosystem II stability/assembly factor-like uncharacterized protein
MTGDASMMSPTGDFEITSPDVVYALMASPTFAADQTCFAARASGLYGSSDGGLTWQPLYGSLKSANALPTSAVAVSSDYGADHTLFAAVEGSVLRSRDGGQSWEIAPMPSSPLIVTLCASPTFGRDGVLFAGTAQDGVYHSADRGNHWVAWNFGLYDLNILCVAVSPDFARDETLFVGTESGLYQSTNGGRAWRELAFPAEYTPVLSVALSPAYSLERGTLYAGTEASGLFRSVDQGQTWERLGENVLPADVSNVAVSADNQSCTDLLALTSAGILVSHDDGVTWQDVSPDLADGQGWTCVAAPCGLLPGAPILLGLSDGAVMRMVAPASTES